MNILRKLGDSYIRRPGDPNTFFRTLIAFLVQDVDWTKENALDISEGLRNIPKEGGDGS